MVHDVDRPVHVLVGWLRRPLVAALVVLAVYASLALWNDPAGYLGTDTGAKVATVDAMARNDSFSPDVGYWAAQWDPEGRFHPLLDTQVNDEGEWINVTTLPMLFAARPLYEAGGYRLALVLPMLGALLAGFACRDVARQVGDDRAGWMAFWVTTLASPIAIYALDLWEHSLGAGLMVAAFALLLRVVRGSSAWWLPLLAGLTLGSSATMRTETFVAAFVFVGAVCARLVSHGRIGGAVRAGALGVVGFAVPWTANAALEGAVGGNSRAARAAGVATGTGTSTSELRLRAEEAATTWFALPGGDFPLNAMLGALAVVSLVLTGAAVARGERRRALLALGAACACYAVGLGSGLAFIPGALVAAPVAVLAALVSPRSQERTLVVVVALVTTALIWVFQYTGGAAPQWGGRYLLAPTLLLVAVGSAVACESDVILRRGALGLAVLVTAFGWLWLGHRSHDVAAFFEGLADRPEDVIVSTNGFLVREAGPAAEDRRYLSVGRAGDLDGAVSVVERSGASTYAVLTEDRRPPRTDGDLRSTTEVTILGVPLYLHSFDLAT